MTDESDELERHVYMHFDGIKKSAEWVIKDYNGEGAFTDAQIEALCHQFQMPRPLIKELSLYVGNSLDSDSEVDLLQVTKSKAIAQANKNMRRARLLLRNGARIERVKEELTGLSNIFAITKADAEILPTALTADQYLEQQLTRLLQTPGSAALLKPDRSPSASDNRRFQVVMSCCYIWEDAGKDFGFSNELDDTNRVDRVGGIYQFVQTVATMVSTSKHRLRGEVFHKDITHFKAYRLGRDPDAFLNEEPEFGPPKKG
ncbi:hypothetical protein GLP59_19035 [Sulfitobacter sp. M220]|uniref:hypothetical protein n=1 Tax=Sulfitobacter sp. M220 TaxID=2675333 RepID=UPI001F3F17E2|nr:hypothetical protein [Sulfitobacter sp. M220]MCF7779682.1 hypothetical protein [Sulfitobacter sp. M220]